MSLRELAESAKRGARAVGREFTHPDDDWAPVVLLETPRGFELAQIEIPEDKDLFAFVLSSLIAEKQASAVAMVTSAWMLTGDPAQEHVRGGPPPSEHPERREVVFVTCLSRDPDEDEGWCAPIFRSQDRPPRLGHFEHFGSAESTVGGRFAYAIRAGLMPRPQG